MKARPGALLQKTNEKKAELPKKLANHLTPGERDIMKTNPAAVMNTLNQSEISSVNGS